MRTSFLLVLLCIHGSLFLHAQTKPTFVQHTISSQVQSAGSSGEKADFNNDGVPDVVLCCDANGNAWYQLSTGSDSFQPPVTLGPGAFPGNTVAAGDFNNDGNDDVLVVNASRGITIYYNQGAGTFTPTTYFPNANALQVAVADFNHDGTWTSPTYRIRFRLYRSTWP